MARVPRRFLCAVEAILTGGFCLFLPASSVKKDRDSPIPVKVALLCTSGEGCARCRFQRSERAIFLFCWN